MPKFTGTLYKVIGTAIIIVAIIATVSYCRSEVKISTEYLTKNIKYPTLYPLDEADDFDYPVAKGIIIVVLATAVGALIYGLGDIIVRIDSAAELEAKVKEE